MLRFLGLCFLVTALVGCAAPRGSSDSGSSSRPQAATLAVEAPSSVMPRETRTGDRPPATEAARQLRTVSTQSQESPVPPPVSRQAASLLQGDFLIEVLTPETLTVRRNTRTHSEASLFEEAISLARVRTVLAATLSRNVGDGATLKNGTVTVTFPKSTDPVESAEAMARILEVQGVDRVKATFK